MNKKIIDTKNAPQAIGMYSQAIRVDNTVYLSGQIPLIPDTMEIPEGDISVCIKQVFDNLKAVTIAAGGDLSDVVKLTIFLTDLSNFPVVNEIMKTYFEKPYPARTTIGVAALPKNVKVEVDAIMVINDESYHY